MGHPVLRYAAETVEDPTAPEIRGLVGDMMETLADADGAGLAAPQVHVLLRIVIFQVPEGRETIDGGAVPLTVLVNPIITPVGDEQNEDWEACLSVPGLTGLVPRWTSIRYSGVTLDGETIEQEADGFHARVVQHECDHLDGILYPARMTDMSTLIFREELRHYVKSADEYDPEGDIA